MDCISRIVLFSTCNLYVGVDAGPEVANESASPAKEITIDTKLQDFLQVRAWNCVVNGSKVLQHHPESQ